MKWKEKTLLIISVEHVDSSKTPKQTVDPNILSSAAQPHVNIFWQMFETKQHWTFLNVFPILFHRRKKKVCNMTVRIIFSSRKNRQVGSCWSKFIYDSTLSHLAELCRTNLDWKTSIHSSSEAKCIIYSIFVLYGLLHFRKRTDDKLPMHLFFTLTTYAQLR